MHPVCRIAVVGGRSRLGVALREGPLAQVIAIVRSGQGEAVRAVGTYQRIGPDDLRGFDAVINCAGLTEGTPSELSEANIALPEALARAARAAGVSRFIHVSSFSVLGAAEHVGPATPERSISAYGHSKREGDRRLLALAAPEFAVVPVRFPAIVGPGAANKVAALIRLWNRLGWFPVPRREVSRSMISYGLAAQVLAQAATGEGSGIRYAADPRPFTYQKAAAALSQAGGRPARLLALPDAAFATLRLAAPGAFQSLYRDSLVEARANRAAAMASDLYPTIIAIAAGRARIER